MRTVPGCTIIEVLLEDSATVLVRAERAGERVLLRLLASDPPTSEEIARLHYGYEVSRGLTIPGVAQVCAFEKYGRTAAVVMEDQGEIPLQSLLARRTFQVAEALRVALQIVDTLGTLHRRRIVHLRVEPAHILVHPVTLEAKLSYFEDSSPLTGVTMATRARYRLTSRPVYVSPEQTGRMNQAVDHRSDFYSLGITLYEMLTGRVPFQETDPLALVYGHIALEPSPPGDISPGVPEAVSRLVMKLLAKNAEERYQSAFGIAADLTECLRQLSDGGDVTSLILGEQDAPVIFSLPHRLYGREADMARLLEAFERVGRGAKELCLVSGASGVGKTALVQGLQKPIVRLKGQFGAGKFDQFHAVPYAGLVQAFGQVIQDILCMSEEDVRVWRERLQGACGDLGRVLADVLPDIELVIGPQSPVPPLGATEAQARFNLVFRRFVIALARHDSPLAIFLDDLQWSDPASLDLIEHLLSDDELSHFYVIGGYRSTEVDSAHPLTALLKRMSSQGLPAIEISLAPLQPRDVERMVGDALGRGDPEALVALADLVYRVTEGSPFFIGQFLTSLWARELLSFDPVRGRWSWSLADIQSSGIPESVGALMAARIARLSPATQDALRLAACIGHTFELQTLAVLCDWSLLETAEQLWQAVAEGFVVPLNDSYKHVQAGSSGTEPARLKFLHDRVQEAAYALGAEGSSNAAVHLRLGRLLLANAPPEDQGALFDIVDQLNLGLRSITREDELGQLAALNLRAGKRAKASAAPAAAFEYLNRGAQLLGEQGWERDHALMFSLCQERAECAYLLGNHELAEAEFKRLLAFSRSRETTVQIQELRSSLHIATMNFPEALSALLDALRLYGVDLPGPSGPLAACQAEAQALGAALAGRSVASLALLPDAREPEEIVRVRLLARAASAAFGGDPLMFVLLASRLTRASIEHGNAPGSAWGFVAYGMVAAASGDYAAAFEFGVLALAVSARLDGVQWQATVGVTANVFNLPWRRNPRASVSAEEQASLRAMAAGDPVYAAMAKWNLLCLEFVGGAALGEIDALAEEHASFFRRLNQMSTGTLSAALQSLVQRLRHCELSAAGRLELNYRTLLGHLSDFLPGLGACATFGLGVAVLLRDQNGASELLEIAQRGIGSLAAHPTCVEFSFYRGLLSAWLHCDAGLEERAEHRRIIEEERIRLAQWAALCPENFRHKERLLAAEAARLDGADFEAMTLYDEAIDSAASNGFMQMEALAGELCARFYVSRGRRRTARAYLSEARNTYARWGAQAKVAALDLEFGALLSEMSLGAEAGPDTEMATSLDLLSVVKASQAISGEMILSVLLQKLMNTLIENAGAQRGLIIVSGEPELYASIDVAHGGAGDVSDSAGAFGFSHSLVRRVQRTRETVVCDDARNDGALSADPYVAQARPRSVLCMPILARSKLVGVLYLENNVTRSAFTVQRCKVLELLSAQAAISIENAQLYDTLESRVRSRTQELADRNQELSQAIARLNDTQQQLVAHEKLASLGTLTAGVAHELKNPLNFVSNFATLSAELADELTQGFHARATKLDGASLAEMEETVTLLRENVLKIGEHGRRADGIINNMLLHARGASSTRSPIELNRLVTACLKLAYDGRPARKGGAVEIQEDYDPNVGRIEATADDIRRVIINLMNNANDALTGKVPVPGSSYKPTIRVTTRAVRDRVEVTIRDNGAGIPPEILSKIYDPFFTTKGTGEGTGLGLSICHGIVRAHHGDLDVRSVFGEFTEVTVSLPRSGAAGRLTESAQDS